MKRIRLDVSQRNRKPELMDDPALQQDYHEHALKGLARVNWISA